MSFGFSPSDIILFSQFVAKVISGLKDEGGSKSEYQLAEQQCQGFLAAMHELQTLRLGDLPESFQRQIKEHSTNLEGFVESFRKAIKQYEKSMGKRSQRHFLVSSPRKVQWALMAAEDLGKFRQSLACQIDLVNIVINMSILSIVANHSSLNEKSLTSTSNSLQATPRKTGYFGVTPDMMLNFEDAERINDLTGLVYERLLTRPNLPSRIHNRIFTLPDIPAEETIQYSSQALAELEEVQALTCRKDRMPLQIRPIGGCGSFPHDILSEEINEYLESLELEKLSATEQSYVDHGDHETSRGIFPVNTYWQSSLPAAERPPPANIKAGSNRKFYKGAGFDFEGQHDAISLASGIMQFVGYAAKVSFDLLSSHRATITSFRETKTLSVRIMQYADLLMAAGQTFRGNLMSRELQNLGWEILKDSRKVMDEVERKLETFRGRSVGRFQVLRRLRRTSNRKKLVVAMEQLESLKSTLAIMLQLYQAKLMERKLDEIRRENFSDTSQGCTIPSTNPEPHGEH